MHNTKTRTCSKILLLAAAAGTLAVGASSVASATTEPPPDVSAAPGADGSAEASSPEAEAFCTAELGIEAATLSEDPAAIGTAIEAAMAVATDDVRPIVEAVVAAFEATGGEGPEFNAAYGELLDWMRANCGFAELNLTASEYEFGGLPEELPAGPAILALANTGEEVHEAIIVRVNDDVALSVEELLALPEEESSTMTTFIGIAFAFPEEIGQTVVDLTPGRYVALCFLPEHADPEMISQMSGPDSSAPPGNEFGPPHFTLGMVQEFTVI